MLYIPFQALLKFYYPSSLDYSTSDGPPRALDISYYDDNTIMNIVQDLKQIVYVHEFFEFVSSPSTLSQSVL